MTSITASHRRIRPVRGFTLVELLTVIAIVGVLAGILIPVISSARARSKSAACMGNLRQIGVAMQLYAKANHNNLPKPLDKTQAEWQKQTWMYQLNPYLENRGELTTADRLALCFDGVFRCPAKPEWALMGTGVTDDNRISYGMSTFDKEGAGMASREIARNLNIFQEPARTMLVMDRATFTAAENPAQQPPYMPNNRYIYRDAEGLWHGGNDNVLFLDGHVEAVPKNGLNYWLMKAADDNLRPW
ncbi:MAG: prepilin-type N-terminal cleavage/methylation domain-containing protein [Opitutaceae bacterium]|jgi:general secretion pathway protein G